MRGPAMPALAVGRRRSWTVAVGSTLMAVTLGACGQSATDASGQPSQASPLFGRGSPAAAATSASEAPASAPGVTVTVTATVTETPSAPAGASVPEPATSGPSVPGVAPVAGRAPSPQEVLQAVQQAGVPLVVEDGWDQEWDLPSRQADWQPIGVMLHHTAAAVPGIAPSRQFLLDYQSTMVLTEYDGLAGGGRGCNVLIGRDGTVYLMRATRGPHAGIGGPMVLGADQVPSDNANGRLFGIEIESAGTSAQVVPGSDFLDGFGEAQVESTARVSAALLELVGRGTDNLTDHKAWAGVKQGKPDLVGDALQMFQARTQAYLG